MLAEKWRVKRRAEGKPGLIRPRDLYYKHEDGIALI